MKVQVDYFCKFVKVLMDRAVGFNGISDDLRVPDLGTSPILTIARHASPRPGSNYFSKQNIESNA